MLDWTMKKPFVERKIVVLPCMSSGLNFGVHNPSLVNLQRALVERVFKIESEDGSLVDCPKPKKNVFDRCLLFRHLWYSYLEPCAIARVEQVVTLFGGSKKKSYERAMQSLITSPLQPKDASLKAFIKADKINRSSKPDPCPRVIQPRSQRYNLVLAKYLRLNEKRMLKAIDRVFGESTILSGYDIFTVGRIIASKWRKYSNPVAILLDFKRLDQHMSVDALKYEHGCYLLVFNGNEELRELLNMQLKNFGVAIAKDGAIYYIVDGKRMSGDINTSLGNKIVVCAMMWTYLYEIGLIVKGASGTWVYYASLSNNGDDCHIITERENEGLITSSLDSWFLDFGFRLTVEKPVYELEEIEFCQSHPVCIDGKWQMVRSLPSISKDCFTLQSIQGRADLEKWLASVGLCGLALNRGVPILQSFHNAFVRNSNGMKVSKEYLAKVVEYGNMERLGNLKLDHLRTRPISDGSRLSFFKSFGVEPWRQLAIEQYYDNVQITENTAEVKSLPTHYSVLHPNNFC